MSTETPIVQTSSTNPFSSLVQVLGIVGLSLLCGACTFPLGGGNKLEPSSLQASKQALDGGYEELPGAHLPRTQPRILNHAWRHPAGGTQERSIPVAVTVICHSKEICPRAHWGRSFQLDFEAVERALERTNEDFHFEGEALAKFELNHFEKVIDPQYYDFIGKEPLSELQAKYARPGVVNVFVVNSMGYAGLAWVDVDLSETPGLAITADGLNTEDFVYLQHELLHAIGARHSADYGSRKAVRYRHVECGSDFEYFTENSSDFESVFASGPNFGQCENTYRNFMSYGSLQVFDPQVSGCIRPTAFTTEWYYDHSVTDRSADYGLQTLPATYGHAYQVILKCWNYRNFN